MVKAMGSRMMTKEADRVKEPEMRNMEAIERLQTQAGVEPSALKASILSRTRWLVKPQLLNPFFDTYSQTTGGARTRGGVGLAYAKLGISQKRGDPTEGYRWPLQIESGERGEGR